MNITIYSHYAFFRYILYCVISGALSAAFYFAVVVIFSAPGIIKCKGIMSYKTYCSRILSNQSGSRHITDFLGCLTVAFTLLVVSFIANSGEFRLLSVVMLALGFYITDVIFKRIIIVAFSFYIYLIKRVNDLLLYPFKLILEFLNRALTRTFSYLNMCITNSQNTKYTKKRFKDLEKIKQNGMLDHF